MLLRVVVTTAHLTIITMLHENNSIETIEPFLKYITNDLIESSESENSFQYKYDNNLGEGDNYKYKCLTTIY